VAKVERERNLRLKRDGVDFIVDEDRAPPAGMEERPTLDGLKRLLGGEAPGNRGSGHRPSSPSGHGPCPSLQDAIDRAEEEGHQARKKEQPERAAGQAGQAIGGMYELVHIYL